MRALNTGLLLVLMLITGLCASGQSFEIYKGDTVNRTDSAGQKQGRWVILNKESKNPSYPEGAILEELVYRNGKKDGLRKQFYPNGKLKSEVIFANNRPTGNAIFYYENGNISEEGKWMFGGWDGKYRNYFEEGNVYSDMQYLYGKKDGIQKTYHPNGKLKSESNWKNGQQNGIMREYTKNGTLIYEEMYVNGALDTTKSKYYFDEEGNPKVDLPAGTPTTNEPIGTFTSSGYFKMKNSAGNISREGLFKNGQLVDGKQYYYSEDGSLKQTILYKDGKAVETIDASDH